MSIFRKIESLGDCYLTFDVAEIFYLTGFRPSFGVCVADKFGNVELYVDSRYILSAKKKAKAACKPFKSLKDIKAALKERRVIVDPTKLKASTLKEISELTLILKEHFLDEFRAVKRQDEIALIAKAVSVAEMSFKLVRHKLKEGITEKEFRGILLKQMFELGADGEAFPTIVASGWASAVPHWQPSDKEIKSGESVVVDFGVVYRGYVSDLTRTVLINADSELKNIYDIVYKAQKKAIAKVAPGVAARSVDEAARKYIESAGYGEFFVHSTGHGLGIDVHEPPTLSPKSDEVLRSGNVITVEPGIYLPQKGGVRIEDDVLVSSDGAFVISDL